MTLFPSTSPVPGLRAGLYEPSYVSRFIANRRPHAVLRLAPRVVLEQEVIVPDVSMYQDKNTTPQGIDFQRMKSNGAQGVIIRAGQGSWPDPDFITNWNNAKAAGLPRGSYWYYDPRVAPHAQADRWIAMFGADLPELDIWGDFEFPDSWGGSYNTWRHMYDFLERLKVKLPAVDKTIYTGYYWWFDHVWSRTTAAQLAYFEQYPLNIASYTDNPELVKIPRPWTTARWWQYTSSGDGLAYGAESLEIDLNYFNGDLESYKQTFGLGSEPPPPGGTMRFYEIKSTINIRSSPAIVSSPSNDVGDLLAGDKVEVSEVVQVSETNKWGKLARITRAGGLNFPLPTIPCYVSLNTTATVEYVPVVDTITLDVTAHDVKTPGDAYEAKGVKLTKVS